MRVKEMDNFVQYKPGTGVINPFNSAGYKEIPTLEDERWRDIQGWLTAEQACLYYDVITKQTKPRTIIEIGTYMGRSTSFAAQCIKQFDKKNLINFITIDTFRGTTNEPKHQKAVAEAGGSLKPIFDDNMKGLLEYITVIEDDSANAALSFDNESVDMVFIDGDHSEEGVVRDILAWKPKIKKTGVLAGDDYHPCWGVFNGVNTTLGTTNIVIDNQTWYYQGKL
jgi:cephalosporin hydroxylase